MSARRQDPVLIERDPKRPVRENKGPGTSRRKNSSLEWGVQEASGLSIRRSGRRLEEGVVLSSRWLGLSGPTRGFLDRYCVPVVRATDGRDEVGCMDRSPCLSIESTRFSVVTCSERCLSRSLVKVKGVRRLGKPPV